jgi:hypothetical protein
MKKTQKNKKKKRQFWGEKHLGKVKAKFSTNSILKKKYSTKIILKKKHGEILYQNKIHVEKIL